MKTIKLILTASIILLLCVSCEKNQEGNWSTYYKTVGEGYIWDATNNRPLEGASITVNSCFSGSDWYVPVVKETFYTDENGYYRIRFVKRARDGKVLLYGFDISHAGATPPPPHIGQDMS
jgi:hypothetical protein